MEVVSQDNTAAGQLFRMVDVDQDGIAQKHELISYCTEHGIEWSTMHDALGKEHCAGHWRTLPHMDLKNTWIPCTVLARL